MPSPMTKDDSARIQSTQAQGGKDMSSSGFASRAQSAGDRNTNTSNQGSNTSGQQGQQSHGGQKK